MRSIIIALCSSKSAAYPTQVSGGRLVHCGNHFVEGNASYSLRQLSHIILLWFFSFLLIRYVNNNPSSATFCPRLEASLLVFSKLVLLSTAWGYAHRSGYSSQMMHLARGKISGIIGPVLHNLDYQLRPRLFFLLSTAQLRLSTSIGLEMALWFLVLALTAFVGVCPPLFNEFTYFSNETHSTADLVRDLLYNNNKAQVGWNEVVRIVIEGSRHS